MFRLWRTDNMYWGWLAWFVVDLNGWLNESSPLKKKWNGIESEKIVDINACTHDFFFFLRMRNCPLAINPVALRIIFKMNEIFRNGQYIHTMNSIDEEYGRAVFPSQRYNRKLTTRTENDVTVLRSNTQHRQCVKWEANTNYTYSRIGASIDLEWDGMTVSEIEMKDDFAGLFVGFILLQL